MNLVCFTTSPALQLGVALDRYWRARSQLQEAFGLLVPVLRRPDARADPALFAAALVTATWAACWIDIATARQLAEQAVQVARQLGDDRLLIRSLAALCDAYFWAGEPDIGRPFGQEAVERARRLGDDVLLARSLLLYLLTVDPASSGHPNAAHKLAKNLASMAPTAIHFPSPARYVA